MNAHEILKKIQSGELYGDSLSAAIESYFEVVNKGEAEDLLALIPDELLPEAEWLFDNQGQAVIYTGVVDQSEADDEV